ncbi:MAG: 50S ribosomal protein L9 [Phycisphaerales bacterium]|nr:50S ribosomal protein L9 [Phycisphaerales bacterium]
MKLLLKKDIPQLGIVGDVVNVARGYARNYLLPQNLATEPTEANMRALADARREAEERRRLRTEKLQATADALADVEVTIEAAANEEGVLYGSVGPREVAAALRDLGHDVNANSVHLRDPIKHLDNVMVPVVLAEKIETKVKVWVVRSKAAIDDENESGDGTEADDRDESGYGD